jgi:hypothetical protein
MDQAPYGALPLAIYEDDDPAWLEELSAEEREASAGELSLRLFALATNAQIDQKEYDGLKQKLGVKLLGL